MFELFMIPFVWLLHLKSFQFYYIISHSITYNTNIKVLYVMSVVSDVASEEPDGNKH